jgi:hypothetical protein
MWRALVSSIPSVDLRHEPGILENECMYIMKAGIAGSAIEDYVEYGRR